MNYNEDDCILKKYTKELFSIIIVSLRYVLKFFSVKRCLFPAFWNKTLALNVILTKVLGLKSLFLKWKQNMHSILLDIYDALMSMYLLYIWLRINFKLLNLQKLVFCQTYIYSIFGTLSSHSQASKHELTLWHYRIVKKKQWKMNQRTFISIRSCHLQQWISGKKLNFSKEAIFETS